MANPELQKMNILEPISPILSIVNHKVRYVNIPESPLSSEKLNDTPSSLTRGTLSGLDLSPVSQPLASFLSGLTTRVIRRDGTQNTFVHINLGNNAYYIL